MATWIEFFSRRLYYQINYKLFNKGRSSYSYSYTPALPNFVSLFLLFSWQKLSNCVYLFQQFHFPEPKAANK